MTGSTLILVMVRVRAYRKGLSAGQAPFGRSASKTEWEYGFKVGLAVSPAGVVTAFGLAPPTATSDPSASSWSSPTDTTLT